MVFVAHHPNIFGTKSKLLHFDPILLTMPCAPKYGLLHLPGLCLESSRNHFGPSHVPCIFLFSLLLPHPIHRCAFAAAHHSVRCFFASPCFLLILLCFETVASWQHCIDYITTSARWSVPVRNLCLAKDWGERRLPLTKTLFSETSTNRTRLSCRIIIIPARASHHSPLHTVAEK